LPYILKPEAGEVVLLDIRFEITQKAAPFHFAITNQALYVPDTKFAIAGDPRYFLRVPKEEVREVCLQKAPAVGAWIGASFLILMGLVLLVSQLMAGFDAIDYRLIGFAAMLVVGSVLLPYGAKGRKRLIIVMPKKVFHWDPPFVVDKNSKQQVQEVLQSILDTCQENGLPVSYR
jgi:hypothetical protein